MYPRLQVFVFSFLLRFTFADGDVFYMRNYVSNIDVLGLSKTFVNIVHKNRNTEAFLMFNIFTCNMTRSEINRLKHLVAMAICSVTVTANRIAPRPWRHVTPGFLNI